MRTQSTAITVVVAAALIAAPLSAASAHGHRGPGLLFGLAALGTAAVVGIATVVTAPVRILAAASPVVVAPAPVIYAAPPVYASPPPVYYAQRPVYYAPPPVYYAPAPAYYAPPPGYVLVPR